jgi:hypothetical protein
MPPWHRHRLCALALRFMACGLWLIAHVVEGPTPPHQAQAQATTAGCLELELLRLSRYHLGTAYMALYLHASCR